MGDHIFLKVLGVTIIALAAALWLPGGQPPEEYKNLPWQIEVTPDGLSQVFGVTLGKSTLSDVENQFQEPTEISLFATDAGERVVEAYFNTVTLNGFKAKIVVTLGFSGEELQGMYDRGERISSLAQGKRKVTLSGNDLAQAKQTPVVALTYLPRIDLAESTVIKRFGEPAEKRMEADGKVEHWLYPDKGLDVVMYAEAREVLQYVAPRDFDRLRKPLQDGGNSTPKL
ncbi:hypothetical protein [Thiolapillus sp.]|uniref:hypothetical protein n=1 Tax=Thiolapillus sp. TaxID=2017437 RepID=UPI003AF8D1E2